MQWIFLIGNEGFNLDILKNMDHFGSVSSYEVNEMGGRYCVDFGADHIFYDLQANTVDFEEDIALVPFTRHTIIMMSYSSPERARRVLRQENFPQNIYIDNDYGLVVPLNEFIRLGMPMN